MLTDALYHYLLEISLREPDVMRDLREESSHLSSYNMQISPEQAQFMHLVVELMGAHKILELGTYTGYSALAMARALPAEGQLMTCDVSQEWTDIAKRYWNRAGLSEKIELRLGPALLTLDILLEEGHAGSFDMVFIDADKVNYGAYYEKSLLLLRSGGLILIDNVLWYGRLIDEREQDKNTRALRIFNEKLHHDKRITLSMLPIGDGLTLARKQ